MGKRSQEHLREFYGADSMGNTPPEVVADIAAQTDASGVAIASLDVSPNFVPGNGDSLAYSADLPPGLTIGVGTGVITGTPTTPGTYNASVYLSSTIDPPAIGRFTWVIT